MISLDSGDKIRGDASAATVVDFIISGLDANAIKQLADGQLASGIGDLFTADSADVVTSIILVNTDSSARAVNLYLTPNGGTARRLIPKDLSLGIGSSLITDGNKISVLDTSGQLLSTWAVDDTPVNGETAQPISSNWAFDHNASSAKHMDALMSAQGDMITRNGSVPKRVVAGTEGHVWTMGASEPTWAEAAGGVSGEGHIFLLAPCYDSIGQGSFSRLDNVDQWLGSWLRSNGASDGDNISWKAYLDTGTYSLLYWFVKNAGNAIADVYIDAAEVGSVDCYNGSQSLNQSLRVDSINMASAGLKTIKLLVDGKNGSASNYRLPVGFIALWRTA